MSAVPSTAPAAPIRVAAGTTAAAAVREAGLPSRGAPDAVVVVRDIDGRLRDLSWAPEADVEVTPVAADTEDGRSVIRHSAAHVLAQAVQEMFPEAKLGIGPPITDGFYYDFDVAEAFTPEDLEALEKRMRQIVKDGQLFSRRVYESKDQAREELADEPYKLELVDDKSGDPEVMEVGGDELTAYDNLNPRTRERIWGDLCRGPHIPTTQVHPGVQADPQLGRVLARRPEQRQPAADLRHRVGVPGGPRPRTWNCIEEAAATGPPQARCRAGPVQLP